MKLRYALTTTNAVANHRNVSTAWLRSVLVVASAEESAGGRAGEEVAAQQGVKASTSWHGVIDIGPQSFDEAQRGCLARATIAISHRPRQEILDMNLCGYRAAL